MERTGRDAGRSTGTCSPSPTSGADEHRGAARASPTRFVEVSRRRIPKVPALRGRTVGWLFYEDSTRTRPRFETAAKRLSADTMNFSVSHVVGEQGRVAARHGRDHRGDGRRLHRRAPPLRRACPSRSPSGSTRQRGQRRRRLARAPDPGAARLLHDPRAPRRRSTAATSPSSATSSTAGWPAATCWAFTDARRRGDAGGAADPAAAEPGRLAGAGQPRPRRGAARRRRRVPAAHAARAHDRGAAAVAARVHRLLRADAAAGRPARRQAPSSCTPVR